MNRENIQDAVSVTQSGDLATIVELLHAHWQRQLEENQPKLREQLAYYIPAKFGFTNHQNSDQRVDGMAEMQAFLAGEKPANLLLGDSGAGKSLFCQSLVSELWQKQQGWIPLFIHLPLLPVIRFLPNYSFETYLQESCHLNLQQVNLLKAKSKILLILDSYDEIQEHNRGENFYQVLKLYEWKIKVIISCRTEGLVRYKSDELLGIFTPTAIGLPGISIEKRYVRFFDAEQIPLYIERWKKLNSALVVANIDYFAEINRLPGVADMIANPFILWAVMEVLPELLKDFKEASQLERYDKTRRALFDRFTQKWFERQRTKLRNNRLIKADWEATIVTDFHNYCQKLADYMWQIGVTCLAYEPHQVTATSANSGTSAAVSKESIADNCLDKFFSQDGNFNDVPDRPLAIIRQGALLRVFGGNTYSFLHSSLMEYFSAKRLFESAAHKITIALGLELNAHLINDDPERIRNGVEYTKHSTEGPHFVKALRDIIEESKYEERIKIAASNAMTILIAANTSFAGEKLVHIRIPWAKVSGGNFDGADLRDADLRNVDVSRAWLNRANLSGCCIDGVFTGELSCEDFNENPIKCAFSHDGGYYFVLTKKSVTMYDALSHKKLDRYTPWLQPNDMIIQSSISSNSNAMLLNTVQRKLIILSMLKGKFVRKKNWGARSPGYPLVLSPDGKWILSTISTLTKVIQLPRSDLSIFIQRWNCKTEKCEVSYEGAVGSVNAVVLSADGQWALVAFANNLIARLDCIKGEFSSIWQEGRLERSDVFMPYSNEEEVTLLREEVTVLALSKDNCWAFSGSKGGTIKRWDCATGKCMAILFGHEHRVESMSVSSDGKWIYSIDSQGYTVKKWDIIKGECVATWWEFGKVADVAISGDAKWLLLVTNYGVKRLDCETTVSLLDYDRDERPIAAIAVSPDGHWFLSSYSFLALSGDGRRVAFFCDDKDNIIKKWDCLTGECEEYWSGPLLWSKYRYNIGVLDFQTRESIARLQFDHGFAQMVLNSDGSRAFFASHDEINVWNCSESKHVGTWTLGDHVPVKLIVLAISRDDRWIFSGRALKYGIACTIIQWDAATGQNMAKWTVGAFVTSLMFSLDSCSVFSGADNADERDLRKRYTIKHWNSATGQCISTWFGLKAKVISLAISPDRKWVVSSDRSGEVIIWKVSNGKICNRYLLDFCVLVLNWSSSDPSLLQMGMANGSVSSWTFHADSATVRLQWRSKSWGLKAIDCQLLGVHGMLEQQQRAFSQKGAKVQLSSKSSEQMLATHNSWIPYETGSVRRSVFDSSFIVRPSGWVVTVARKKSGAHAFMIVESVEEVSPGVSYYRIRRIDFLLELRHSVLPKGASEPKATDKFGQGLIEIADQPFEDARRLAEKCCHVSEGIDFLLGIELLKAIYEDKAKRLAYCKPGGGSPYGLFTLREAVEHHNCLSWIRKHLEAISVDLVKGKLKDFFYEDPREKLPVETKHSCI